MAVMLRIPWPHRWQRRGTRSQAESREVSLGIVDTDNTGMQRGGAWGLGRVPQNAIDMARQRLAPMSHWLDGLDWIATALVTRKIQHGAQLHSCTALMEQSPKKHLRDERPSTLASPQRHSRSGPRPLMKRSHSATSSPNLECRVRMRHLS